MQLFYSKKVEETRGIREKKVGFHSRYHQSSDSRYHFTHFTFETVNLARLQLLASSLLLANSRLPKPSSLFLFLFLLLFFFQPHFPTFQVPLSADLRLRSSFVAVRFVPALDFTTLRLFYFLTLIKRFVVARSHYLPSHLLFFKACRPLQFLQSQRVLSRHCSVLAYQANIDPNELFTLTCSSPRNMTSADLNWVAPHIKLNPPESFYRNSPTDPPATFSTRCGKIPVRQLPDPAPPVVIRSNVDGDIRSMATSLRQDFPAIVREIKKPTSWYNLYNYFDAVDLWYQGASFLFYVLNHISNENIVLNHELEESKHQEISNWAKLWVEANVKRILSIPPGQDLISTFDESEMESIRGLEPRQKTILRQELNNHRKGYEQLLVPVEDPRVQSHQQSFQQMHQQDPSQHPIHHQVPQRQPMMQPSMQPSMPAMHPGPSMTGKPYPMAVDEPRRNQIVPSK